MSRYKEHLNAIAEKIDALKPQLSQKGKSAVLIKECRAIADALNAVLDSDHFFPASLQESSNVFKQVIDYKNTPHLKQKVKNLQRNIDDATDLRDDPAMRLITDDEDNEIAPYDMDLQWKDEVRNISNSRWEQLEEIEKKSCAAPWSKDNIACYLAESNTEILLAIHKRYNVLGYMLLGNNRKIHRVLRMGTQPKYSLDIPGMLVREAMDHIAVEHVQELYMEELLCAAHSHECNPILKDGNTLPIPKQCGTLQKDYIPALPRTSGNDLIRFKWSAVDILGLNLPKARSHKPA